MKNTPDTVKTLESYLQPFISAGFIQGDVSREFPRIRRGNWRQAVVLVKKRQIRLSFRFPMVWVKHDIAIRIAKDGRVKMQTRGIPFMEIWRDFTVTTTVLELYED